MALTKACGAKALIIIFTTSTGDAYLMEIWDLQTHDLGGTSWSTAEGNQRRWADHDASTATDMAAILLRSDRMLTNQTVYSDFGCHLQQSDKAASLPVMDERDAFTFHYA